jgi:hypothetical protein
MLVPTSTRKMNLRTKIWVKKLPFHSKISTELLFIPNAQSPRRACCCTVRRELGRRCAPGPSPTGRTPASSASSDQSSSRSKLPSPTYRIYYFFGLFVSHSCKWVWTSAHAKYGNFLCYVPIKSTGTVILQLIVTGS